jgi:FtsP/CotA-like multicopper oxidase with cupredoxin domain
MLTASLSFQTRKDAGGRTLYCFMTPDGLENPTLHVSPGDTLEVTVTNNTPRGMPMMKLDRPNCGAATMTSASVNIHYHGTNVRPNCTSDEVIKTLINPGQTFRYRFTVPLDEPPGLYWYHPHVHGVSERMVMGGATGALIVNGIEKMQPAVGGLPGRIFQIRDQRPAARRHEGEGSCDLKATPAVPFRDITVNDVPNDSSVVGGKVVYAAGKILVRPGTREFWRIGNSSSDTILDLRLMYDGVPQTLELAAIDGVPVNSQDGTGPGSTITVQRFRLPPAARIELIVTTPAANVKTAQLVTHGIDTGKDGDCDPGRPLFNIVASADAPVPTYHEGGPFAGTGRRFAGLGAMRVTARRTLFFKEHKETFFMTVAGQKSRPFDPNMPPAIITRVGAVEEWIVQNRTHESHEFHIHQIHFRVQSQDHFGKRPPAPGIVGQYLDTIDVPAWDGSGPYPSVRLLMDFRGDIAGRFVFHCHILNHEDRGMMNIIEVRPSSVAS